VVDVEEGQHLHAQGFAHGLVLIKVNLEQDNVGELLHELHQLQQDPKRTAQYSANVSQLPLTTAA
jgi:hypothetical protein